MPGVRLARLHLMFLSKVANWNSTNMVLKVLVVGTGPTGAVCAHVIRKELQKKVQIDVWDKSRGIGGRMSTSRDPGNPECIADLGAQYLTVTPEYAKLHKSYHSDLQSAGLVSPLSGGIEGIRHGSYPPETKHYVTPKGISSIVKHFLSKSESNVLFDRCLTSLSLQAQGSDAKVLATSNRPSEPESHPATHPEAYDAVILTMPAPQVLQLRGLVAEKIEHDSVLRDRLEKVNYSSRYALALFYPPEVTLGVPWKGCYEQKDECIRWMSVDNRKRQDDKACTALVVHTSVPFGIKHLEADKSEVEVIIRRHLSRLLPDLPEPVRTKCQRWRYSQVSTPCEGNPGTLVLDEGPSHIVLVAGDGMTQSNFDGCVESAEATCSHLLKHWRTTTAQPQATE